jgi:hypothetical protein
MAINKLSDLMIRRIKSLPEGALQSYHLENGCCEESPCLWVCLNNGWEFESMGCGSLHEGTVREAIEVMKTIRKI